ncbi:hypothetical protein Tco_0222869 [Tanacetum coccineum]
MPYPRFTKVIISHFISKDKAISTRNRVNLHTIRDDSLLGTLKFVSKTQDYQQYGALIPDDMINQAIKDSKAYKTYYDFATGKATPKKAMKYKKVASPSRILSPVLEEEPTEKPKRARKPAKKSTTIPTAGVVIRDTPQTLPKSKNDSHMLHASGSDDGVGSQPKVPDKSEDKTTGTDKGTDSSDDESNDDNSDEVTKNNNEDDVESDANEDKEEYDELYKDVNVRSKVAEHEEVGKGDVEMTDTTHESASQEKSYEQVIEDAHLTLTSSQKTKGSKQSSSISSDFENKFLNLDNVLPVVDEVVSLINVKTPREESSTQAHPILSVPVTAILEISTFQATTVPPLIQPFSSIPQMTTPTPIPTTEPTTSSIPALPDFASLFGFNQRVSALEQELSQVKQVDYSAQILAQIPAIVDEHLSTRIGFATQTDLPSYTAKFEKKDQAEKEKYIDIIEKSVKEIIKDEVKSQLPQILPKEVSDFVTPVIQSAINKSLENILLDKIQKSKSYRGTPEHKQLYDALIKSYNLDKDLFESYGNTYSLKRDRDDKDQDKDPSARSDQGLKKRKTIKDAKPSKGSKLKEYKSSSSKGSKS